MLGGQAGHENIKVDMCFLVWQTCFFDSLLFI